jgi:glutamate synthase (NADPH/NADH) large chain
MAGGLITVRLDKKIREVNPEQTILGNVALFGATGGTLLVAGKAGERFAVRNSGAAAVVEGIGNHGCEYMTRGTVLVLGTVGNNFGAGMSGGVAYLYDVTGTGATKLNLEYVRTDSLTSSDEELIKRLLRNHIFHTGSIVSKYIMNNWDEEKERLIKIVPKVQDTIDFQNLYTQQIARRQGIYLADGE